MKARITGIVAAVVNIAFVAFVVFAGAAQAQDPSGIITTGTKTADSLIDLGALGIFCLVLIAANGAQFWMAHLERKAHKQETKDATDGHRAELKERNDLLAKWAEQTTRAVADATAATAAATSTTAQCTQAMTRLTEQMARSDAATARSVERLERLEGSGAHGVGGRG